jgi:hypothetical protein
VGRRSAAARVSRRHIQEKQVKDPSPAPRLHSLPLAVAASSPGPLRWPRLLQPRGAERERASSPSTSSRDESTSSAAVLLGLCYFLENLAKFFIFPVTSNL